MSLDRLGSGYLFRLLPICALVGSVYFSTNRPDYPRYDATAWIVIGGIYGLIIGSIAMGVLTLIFRVLGVIWNEIFQPDDR